jgi:hypothetical protein
MTWQGEHDEEGDMALYATDPFARVVGPGIGRALYGGFLLVRPPGTMFGVWEDPYYARPAARPSSCCSPPSTTPPSASSSTSPPPRPARPCARPRSAWTSKIVHVPLGQLSPVTLKRLRVFHVLGDRAARTTARTYIRD